MVKCKWMRGLLIAFFISFLIHSFILSITAGKGVSFKTDEVIEVHLESTHGVVFRKKGKETYRENSPSRASREFEGKLKGKDKCSKDKRKGSSGIVSLPAFETPPAIKKLVKPSYTAVARELGIEGTVIVELVIAEDGRAIEGKIIRGLGYGLDEVTLNSLMNSEFEPAKVNGNPVLSRVVVPVRFELKD